MKQKSLMFKLLGGALALTLVLGLAAVATGTNDSTDPLVTLSYLTNTFKPDLLEDVEDMIDDKAEDMEKQVSTQATSLEKAMDSQSATVVSNDYAKKTVTAGQTVSVSVGNELLWLSGSATVGTSCLTDTTAGSAVSAATALSANHLYVATGSGTITATTDGTYLIK